MKLSSGFAAITFIVGLLVGLPLSVTANENPYENLTFCSNKKTGVVRYTDGTKCKKKELKILVGMQGPQGPVGPEGPKGDPGPAVSSAGRLLQANGEEIPWKVLEFGNHAGGYFLFDTSGEGGFRKIFLSPRLDGYPTSENVYYSDSSCSTPTHFSIENGRSVAQNQFYLRHNEMAIVKIGGNFGYIDTLGDTYENLSGEVYLTRISLADLAWKPGIQQIKCELIYGWVPMGVKITSIKPLPTLSFPLKWVTND